MPSPVTSCSLDAKRIGVVEPRHPQILELSNISTSKCDALWTQLLPSAPPTTILILGTRDRQHAEVLLRLLRCVPHSRQYERAQSAQQRSQPPAQRPSLLRANIERPDTAGHQQHHRCIQLGRPSESTIHSELEWRISWRTNGTTYGYGRADGNADARWFPATR